MTWPVFPTWGDIAALLGLAGVAARQQRLKGIQEQKLKDIADKIAEHAVTITAHTAALAAHEGSFKVIDVKLDNIKEGVDELKGRGK